MRKPASSRKKIPTEVWVALIGLVGVLVTALLSSPLINPLLERATPQGPSETTEPESGSVMHTPASVSTPDVVTPRPIAESTVVVELQNGSVVQFPMSTLNVNFGDGESLKLYSGVHIPFDKLKSFEIVRIDGEDNITVTVILLDGQSTTERVDEYSADSGEITGTTTLGPFFSRFSDLKKVEFQR